MLSQVLITSNIETHCSKKESAQDLYFILTFYVSLYSKELWELYSVVLSVGIFLSLLLHYYHYINSTNQVGNQNEIVILTSLSNL